MKFITFAIAFIGAASAGYIAPAAPLLGGYAAPAFATGAPLAYSAPAIATAPALAAAPAFAAAPALAAAPVLAAAPALAYSTPVAFAAPAYAGYGFAAAPLALLKKKAAA
ncbi:unnamed protein product [Hermetia illucens]|uniref:Cuticle protein 16.5 n=1 Tax=Hermetia illucens TaxID=343691 RepID=A0A7R8UIR4_HERIL|nr:cuticle protein 21.3-like [Hermetia illucens]CAD7081617.1 unnamed protein product [Hermetia illucens]